MTEQRDASNPGDQDALIAMLCDAVATAAMGSLDRAVALGRLSEALFSRFEENGTLADLHAAVDAGRAAVEATPADHPLNAAAKSVLAVALRTLFERTGEHALLSDAIQAGREAAAAIPSTDPDHCYHQSNLCSLLHSGYAYSDDPAMLSDAITAGRAALAAASTDDPARQVILASLGSALLTRSEITAPHQMTHDAALACPPWAMRYGSCSYEPATQACYVRQPTSSSKQSIQWRRMIQIASDTSPTTR